MPRRSIPPLEHEDVVHVQPVPCLVCSRTFDYRYYGPYHEDALRPIDQVCRECLPAWAARWSEQMGWV